MDEAIVRAAHVRRSFGKVTAVRDASLTLRPGQITGLVGPNGAGKTTLLLMLATLVQPDSGTLRFVESSAENVAAARSRIGWMPDALGTWPALTVRETLEYTAKLNDLDKAHAHERAGELIGMFDLHLLADQPAKVLSRGQKQRLGLARALVHKPQVLLLDEPAAGLDPDARIHMRELLREYANDGGAVLISSHVLAELDDIVDDAVFMFQGVTAERPQHTRTGRRAWRLRAAGETLEIETVARIIGNERISQDRAYLRIEFAGELDAARALTALIAAGISVSEFSPEHGELEHEFMSLQTREP
ncbi:MAG: ABC transporter ATP-binding protein [Canibacter sp.]